MKNKFWILMMISLNQFISLSQEIIIDNQTIIVNGKKIDFSENPDKYFGKTNNIKDYSKNESGNVLYIYDELGIIIYINPISKKWIFTIFLSGVKGINDPNQFYEGKIKLGDLDINQNTNYYKITQSKLLISEKNDFSIDIQIGQNNVFLTYMNGIHLLNTISIRNN